MHAIFIPTFYVHTLLLFQCSISNPELTHQPNCCSGKKENALDQINTCFYSLPLLHLPFLSHYSLSWLSQGEDHMKKGGSGFCPGN